MLEVFITSLATRAIGRDVEAWPLRHGQLSGDAVMQHPKVQRDVPLWAARLMDKHKPKKIGLELPHTDLEQEAQNRPAEPVVTDSNDEPAADASGDSDDERENENEAAASPEPA